MDVTSKENRARIAEWAARDGVELTWPDWTEVAKQLVSDAPPPARPSVFDPSAIRALYRANRELARLAVLAANVERVRSHQYAEFRRVLTIWEKNSACESGHEGPESLASAVSAGRSALVGLCWDCGRPVYVQPPDTTAPRLIWPADPS